MKLEPAVVLVAILFVTGCGSSQPSSPPPADAPSQDNELSDLAHQYLEDLYERQPTQATALGIHKYDDTLENYSRRAVTDAVTSARQFRDRVSAIDAKALSSEKQLDREQLLHAIDSRLLTLEVVRPWAKDADIYSSGLTNTAYLMIKRAYAPEAERLRQLVAREKAMPAALAEARNNLESPPRIYTEIAIETTKPRSAPSTHSRAFTMTTSSSDRSPCL